MYIQTWGYVAKLREILGEKVYRILQKVCGYITGHEWSKTEWGYGEDGVDVWCRWCNKFDSSPVKDAVLLFPRIRKLIYNITGELPLLKSEKSLDKPQDIG